MSSRIKEVEKFNLLDRAFHSRLPAALQLVLVQREYRNPLSVVQHIGWSVYQRLTLLDNVADEDILPDSSNSGCMISLMAHFRLHPRYKELQKTKPTNSRKLAQQSKIFHRHAHNFPCRSFNFSTPVKLCMLTLIYSRCFWHPSTF